MTAPVSLSAIIVPIVLKVLRFVVGMSGALILYAVIKSQLQPYFLSLIRKIETQLSSFHSSIHIVVDLITYLDFFGCVSLILSTISVCFFLKIVALSVKSIKI